MIGLNLEHSLSIKFISYREQHLEEMIGIDSEDEPARRIMRPSIPAKFINALQPKQTTCSTRKNSNRYGKTQTLKKTIYKKQTQVELQNPYVLTASKMQVSSTAENSIVFSESTGINYTQITYEGKLIFKGIYKHGKKTKGHFKFNNGFQYSGACNGNSFQGEGSLIFPSGKVISGIWRQSIVVGRAKIFYPNGEIYLGTLKDYKKHGHGQFYFNSRQKYVGQFRRGNITGEGTYFIDEKPVFEGFWFEGQITDKSNVQSLQKLSEQQFYGSKSTTNPIKIAQNDEEIEKLNQPGMSILDCSDIQ